MPIEMPITTGWSALLIDLTGGRIETHFHVFGSLAFLAFYRDAGVLIAGTLGMVLGTVAIVASPIWALALVGVLLVAVFFITG